VTVTHPEVRRYFMLIPEAVHLVMQAASLGEQGATYVLDMGEQIRVVDLARNLIRLSGFIPGQEIPLQFIGLRPGEKLTEELVGQGETAEPSPREKILRIRVLQQENVISCESKLAVLETAALLNDSAWTVDKLQELVPTFSQQQRKAGRRNRAGTERAHPASIATNRQ
jgi:FlaA1/EpsC-like NDP-sugar epimerase